MNPKLRLTTSCCVSLGKTLSFSEPQAPYFYRSGHTVLIREAWRGELSRL